jgi:hypothetical protein
MTTLLSLPWEYPTEWPFYLSVLQDNDGFQFFLLTTVPLLETVILLTVHGSSGGDRA